MEDNKLYYVEVKWYNDYEDKNDTNQFYAFSPNLKDLGERIDKCYNYIENVKIKEVNGWCGSSNFLYVDGLSKTVRDIINEANNY